MTNDPFDDSEHSIWQENPTIDHRFHTALRLDVLLNTWETARPRLHAWNYNVDEDLTPRTSHEVKRFLSDWIEHIHPLYMAVSLPPTFSFPDESIRSKLIESCMLPVAHEYNIPLALMIGVKKLTNPELRVGGDSVGKGDVCTVEYLCENYPQNKFLVTMLSRENQHELCVAARKFRNLMIFGCWWFLNNPSLIEEMSRMRFEMLGTSVIPQHSDARVLDQVIYKWLHSKKIIAEVLADRYCALADTGWIVSEEEIRRDVTGLFSGNFWSFLNHPQKIG
jgi:hypothetical protein